MPTFQEQMKQAMLAAGFREATVDHHSGKAPRWMAYGYDEYGCWRHVTFYGQEDWQSALRLVTGASSGLTRTDPPAREPVTTREELVTLNSDEVLEGYRDGLRGEAEPGDNRSKSYWHGWRNGMVDGGHRPKDAAQAQLAHEYLQPS